MMYYITYILTVTSMYVMKYIIPPIIYKIVVLDSK